MITARDIARAGLSWIIRQATGHIAAAAGCPHPARFQNVSGQRRAV
jgi:hypothetical protein